MVVDSEMVIHGGVDDKNDSPLVGGDAPVNVEIGH